MAKALFITTQDVKEFTETNGNLDPDQFRQFAWYAQDIEIRNVLGTRLYEKLQNDVINSTLAGEYLFLIEEFVKPMLIHYTMVKFLPFSAYRVSNGGVVKMQPEDSIVASQAEISFIIERHRDIAESYVDLFQRWICYRQTQIPEYYQAVNEEEFPTRENYFGGWQI